MKQMFGIIIYLNTRNTSYKPFPPRIPYTNQRDLIRNLKSNIMFLSFFVLYGLNSTFNIKFIHDCYRYDDNASYNLQKYNSNLLLHLIFIAVQLVNKF